MRFSDSSDHIGNDLGAFRDNRGIVALILVVWIMLVLIAIVTQFSFSMRTELKIMRNFKEEEEAYQLALAGIEKAKLEILVSKEPSYMYMNEEGILILDEEVENPVREGKIEGRTFSYILTDEDGKLNINSSTLEQIKFVIQQTGVEFTEVDTISDSIIDWRDENDLHMLNGAEEDYYKSLDKPYSCKDGPFDIIDELLLVKGVTPEIYYGSDDKNEDKDKAFTGLINYLTPWSQMTININTASSEVLEAVLGAKEAQNILFQRASGPIYTPVRGGAVSSSFFTIVSTGSVSEGRIKRTVKAALHKNGNMIEVIYWNDNFIG